MEDEKKETKEKIEEKPLKKKNHKSYRDGTFIEKLWYIKGNITVEPLLAGLIIPSVISRFAMTNFNLDKACRVSLQFPDEVCDGLIRKNSKNYTFYEKEVQKLIASIDIWKGIIHTALPCIIVMFLGAWSDRTGKRKLCILLPICGELATSINNVINVYFFYEIPVQVTVFLETFFPAITGGWVTMFLGVFSYISDITSEESRTFRVGLVNFCMTAGLPIGLGIGGILVQKMGYYGIFSMTTVMFSMILMYGCFGLKEPEAFLKEKGLTPIERPRSNGVSFFDTTHVVDTIAVAFKKRTNNRRSKVLLTLFAVFILYGPTMSEHHIFYLYVRSRLNWDMVKYSLYTSYSIILHSFGAMFSITVLSRKLQIDDSLLCLISVSSKFVGSIWTAFVTTDIEMYIIPVAEILNATTFTSLRSILTKLVEKQDIGWEFYSPGPLAAAIVKATYLINILVKPFYRLLKGGGTVFGSKVNSLFSLTETFAALLFQPFYSWLYMSTLLVLPGAVFLTSSMLIIPAAGVLISFYVQHRIALRNARKNALEAEERKEAEANKSQKIEKAQKFYSPD